MVVNEKTRSLKKKGTKTVVASASVLLASTAFAAGATETVIWDSATPPSVSSITVEKSGSDSANALNITGAASGTLSNASVTLTATEVSAAEKEVQLSAASWSNNEAGPASQVSNTSSSVVFGGDTTTFEASASVTDDTNPIRLYAFNRFGSGTPVSFNATTTTLSSTNSTAKGHSVSGLSVIDLNNESTSAAVNFGGTTVNINATTNVDRITDSKSADRRGAVYGIENKAGTIESTAQNFNVTVNSTGTTVAPRGSLLNKEYETSAEDGKVGAANAYGIATLGGTISASNQTTIKASAVGGTAIGLQISGETQELPDSSSVTSVSTVNLENANITATSTSANVAAIFLSGDKDSSGNAKTTANLKITGDLETDTKGLNAFGIYSEGYTNTEIDGKATMTGTGERDAYALYLRGGTVTIKGAANLTSTAGTAEDAYGISAGLNSKQVGSGDLEGSTVNLEDNVTINATATGEASFAAGAIARGSTVNLGSQNKTVTVNSSGYYARALEVGLQGGSINLGKAGAKLAKVALTTTGSDETDTFAIYAHDYGAVNVYANTYEQTSSGYGIYAYLGNVTLNVDSFKSETGGSGLYVGDSGTINLTVAGDISLTGSIATDYGTRLSTDNTTIAISSKTLTMTGDILVGLDIDSDESSSTSSSSSSSTPSTSVSLTVTEKATIMGDITLRANTRGGDKALQNTVTLKLGDQSTLTGDISVYGLGFTDQTNKVTVETTGTNKTLTYTGGVNVTNGGEVSVTASEIDLKELKNNRGTIDLKAGKISLSETTPFASDAVAAISIEEGTATLTAKEISIAWNAPDTKEEGVYPASHAALMATDKATLTLTPEVGDSSDSSLAVSLEPVSNELLVGIYAGVESSITVNHENVSLNVATAKTADDSYANQAPIVARGIYALDIEKATSLTFAGNLTANVRANNEVTGIDLELFAFDTTDTSKAQITTKITGDATISALIDENGSDSGAAKGIQLSRNSLL